MKKFGLLLLLCLLGSYAPSASARERPVEAGNMRDINALVALIKNQLPPGWQVSYKKAAFPEIEVDRMQPTMMDSPVNYFPGGNTAFDEKPEKRRFSFDLFIEKFLTPSEYRRLSSSNRKTQKEMDKLVVGLFEGKNGYMANNPAEARRVRRYEQLEKTLYQLPHYYWQHVSLLKNDVLPDMPDYQLVQDEKVMEECKQVMLATLKLLHTYPKTVPSKQ